MSAKPPSAFERRLVGRAVRSVFLRDRRGKRWPVPDWLPHEPLRFEGNTGAQISGRWFPARDARGTVVLAHPDRRYGQHWFVVSGRIDALHDAGYNALTFDFADYGESRGGSTYYFEDLVAAARLGKDLVPRVPLHLMGVSLGAFTVANAAPHIDFAESLVLESPYPTFNAWYGRGPGRWAMETFDRLFPRTAALIQAPRNLGLTTAKRVLVAASRGDTVTPADLSRIVAQGGPADRTTYLELSGPEHLELWTQSAEYRSAVLATLEGPAPAEKPMAVAARGRPRGDASHPHGRIDKRGRTNHARGPRIGPRAARPRAVAA